MECSPRRRAKRRVPVLGPLLIAVALAAMLVVARSFADGVEPQPSEPATPSAADSLSPPSGEAAPAMERAVPPERELPHQAGPAAPEPAGQAAAGAAAEAAAPVPFRVGETLSYEVSVGLFGGSGRGTMQVVGIDTVRQRPAYHLRMHVKGSVFVAKVDDRLESWLDVARLHALRFEQDQHEVRYKRHRILDFFPEERRWARVGTEEGGEMETDAPLDDVSFLYFVRTIPLEVGQTYTFNRYFKKEGNPVILKVLRKERVKLPAGRFDTIVVRPIIRSGGLFGKGGEAEVFFSDDARRLPVQVRSKLPVIGHLNLALESYTAGETDGEPEEAGGGM